MTKAQNLGQNVKTTAREEAPGPRQHRGKHQSKKKKGKH